MKVQNISKLDRYLSNLHIMSHVLKSFSLKLPTNLSDKNKTLLSDIGDFLKLFMKFLENNFSFQRKKFIFELNFLVICINYFPLQCRSIEDRLRTFLINKVKCILPLNFFDPQDEEIVNLVY